MSVIIDTAIRTWRSCRQEFEDYREAAFAKAHEACAGQLLNERGRRNAIDPWSLFIGPEIRANAYASEELRAHWAEHPRVTFERFERAWFEGQVER